MKKLLTQLELTPLFAGEGGGYISGGIEGELKLLSVSKALALASLFRVHFREWRTALIKAKVKHRPSYQLRHTFASLYLQQGAEASWVGKILGHSSLQVTFKHYARYIDDKSGRNEAKLEQFLSEQKSSEGVHSPDKSTKSKV